jgi:FlaA1/EpsC-like NDP-sugar epimerase
MLYRFKQLIVLIGDFFWLYLSLFFALAIRYLEFPLHRFTLLLNSFWPLFLLSVIIFYIASLYDVSKKKSFGELIQNSVISALVWMFLGFAYFYFQQSPIGSPKTILFLTAIFYALFTSFWRYLHFRYLAKNILKTKTVIIGLTKETLEIANLFIREPERGYVVCCFVEIKPELLFPENLIDYPLFNSFSDLK